MSPHILLFKLCIDFFIFFFLLLLSALASILFYSILFLHNRLAVTERKAGLSQSCQLAMTHGNRHQREEIFTYLFMYHLLKVDDDLRQLLNPSKDLFRGKQRAPKKGI